MSTNKLIDFTIAILQDDKSVNNSVLVTPQYINEIYKLKHLYTIISNMYGGNVSEFLTTLKDSLLHRKKVTFTNLPYVFRDFYSIFSNLLIIHTHRRHTTIRNNLRLQELLNDIVIKYDYYFGGQVIETLDLGIGQIKQYLNDKQCILAQGIDDTSMTLWNTQTDERKVFTLSIPQIRLHRLDTSAITEYTRGKFAFTVYANSLDNEPAERLGTYVVLVDFNTEPRYYRMPGDPSVWGFTLIDPTRLLIGNSNDVSAHILNIETLEGEDVPDILGTRSIILSGDTIIAGDRDMITFWDSEEQKVIDTIRFDREMIGKMEFLDTHKLLFIGFRHIGLVNTKNRTVTKQVNIFELETAVDEKSPMERVPSKRIIIYKGEIIIHSSKRIFVFDYDLNLLRQSPLDSRISQMAILPNDTLMTISIQALRIWNLTNFELLFETTQISGFQNIIINGRVYSLVNGEIVVY